MSKNKLTKRILFALGASMLSLMPLASALPNQGAYDNSAVAAISTAGNTMSITGKNTNNILNWLTFSVGKGETVRFTDKNNYLNLVNGVDISRIYGTISGGNNVYLVNPYGILFGQGATLDNVGSFVASTRDISDINKQAFLNDPNNVTGVLYTDKGESRNKDYFPDNSPYVPTISVAEINLTNVPASATKIVLDGPSGVVLKNTDVLDKISQVSTRAYGGEVGIGSSNANIVLNDTQKQKIVLFDGQNSYGIAKKPDVLKKYNLISNANELQSMTHGNYVLASNIDVSSINNFTPMTFLGNFDGLGYDISNLRINRTTSVDGSAGLFSIAQGTIRNLNLKEVDIAGGYSFGGIGAYEPPNRTYDAVGAVAAKFNGSISNVHVTSSIEKNDGVGTVNGSDAAHITGYGAVRGYDRVGGLVGQLGHDEMGIYNKGNEIRNSGNGATIVLNGIDYVGGIVGEGTGNLFNVYNTGNINIGSPYKVRQSTYYPEGIGGIAGELYGRILTAYNKGRVFGGRYAAGIVGLADCEIGDTYNLGDIIVNDYAYNYVGNIIGAKGTVSIHGGWGTINLPDELDYYTSQENGRKFPSYYVKGKLKTLGDDIIKGVDFGIGVTDAEMNNMLFPSQQNTGDNGGSTNGGTSEGTSGGNGTNGSNSGTNGGSTNNGTGNGTSSGTSDGLTDDDIRNNIEKAKAKIALQEYNDILTGVKKDSGSQFSNNPNYSSVINSEQIKIKPSLTEKKTNSERIFDITPGYYQPGYNTDGGGLFVYNLNADNDPNSKTPITFDLYNTQNATGYIEYYDKNGNFITAERIDPFSPVISSPESFVKRTDAVLESIGKNGLFGKTDVTDKINSNSRTFTAEAGTYKVVVTNNPKASIYGQVSNVVDDWFEAVDMAATVKSVYGAFTAYENTPTKLTVNQILDNVKEEVTKQISREVAKGAAKEAGKSAGKEFLNSLAKEGTQELIVNIMEGLDRKKILEDAFADTFTKHGGEIAHEIGKEAATTMVSEVAKSNPGVLGYNLMVAVGKGLNELSNEITEKKLENVRPMVFQLNY